MDIKAEVSKVAKTAKFEGVSFHVKASADSRLEVAVEAKGSIDLPGDADAVIAGLLGTFGLGNSKPPSTPSEP